MRALFLLLLLTNILFFGWANWIAAPRGGPGYATKSQADSRSIRLVRESPRVPDLASSSGTADDLEALQAAPCVSIGPFVDQPAADAALARLAGLGFRSRVRVSTDEIWAGHWVRVPELATPEDAANALAALRGLGASDAVMLADGSPGNVVSLGVFSEQGKADAAAALARYAGLSPVVSDRFRLAEVQWIDIDRRVNAGLPRLEDLGAESDPMTPLAMRVCPSESTAAGADAPPATDAAPPSATAAAPAP